MNNELLANRIAAKIKEKIQNGYYKQNARLTVRMLCDEFQVSETPIKQALNQLSGMGLVIAIPKCGIKVKSFNFTQMSNIWDARLMIELHCVPQAIAQSRDKQGFRDKIEKLLIRTNTEYQHCHDEFTKENFTPLSTNDYAFHLEIVKCCANPLIIQMYENLHTHESMFVGFDVHTPASMLKTKEQHTKIAHALLDADQDALKKAIVDHIDTTIMLYRQHAKHGKAQ